MSPVSLPRKKNLCTPLGSLNKTQAFDRQFSRLLHQSCHRILVPIYCPLRLQDDLQVIYYWNSKTRLQDELQALPWLLSVAITQHSPLLNFLFSQFVVQSNWRVETLISTTGCLNVTPNNLNNTLFAVITICPHSRTICFGSSSINTVPFNASVKLSK